MSDMTWDIRNVDAAHDDERRPDTSPDDPWPVGAASHSEYVTIAGAEWLASASTFPRSVRALWSARPTAPSVLPCGTVFDVVNLPALFGRRVLDRLWSDGPGCGPVAVYRGRILIFAKPGTADRLPSLLTWEEWGPLVPPPLCHGVGDAVTVPPLVPPDPAATAAPGAPVMGTPAAGDGSGDDCGGTARWLVAPGVRHPWLPGAAVLLWACLRAARPDGGLRG